MLYESWSTPEIPVLVNFSLNPLQLQAFYLLSLFLCSRMFGSETLVMVMTQIFSMIKLHNHPRFSSSFFLSHSSHFAWFLQASVSVLFSLEQLSFEQEKRVAFSLCFNCQVKLCQSQADDWIKIVNLSEIITLFSTEMNHIHTICMKRGLHLGMKCNLNVIMKLPCII